MTTDLATDEELIAAIQRKDVRALETLYDRHRTLAFSLCLRMVGNQGDAEDVLQESFLNVWRSAATFRPERSSGRAWLLSIVHHRAIDKLRGRQSRPQSVALEEGMSTPDNIDVWREVANNLTGQSVRRALDTLPPEQRETIELAYFKGYTHSEIAERLDLPLGTVKGRMRIGLHKLRSLLQGSQTELGVE